VVADDRATVTSYRIEHRAVGDDSVAAVEVAADATGGALGGLVNGVAREVRVRAVSAVGDGAPTAWVSVTPTGLPAAPTGLTATARPGAAVVRWVAPVSDPSRANPTSYSVQVKDPVTASTTVGCTSLTFTCRAQGLVNGRSVEVRVVSMVGATAAGASPWVSVKPIAAPSRPTGVTVVWRSSGRAQLYWTPSTTTAAPATGYKVWVNGRLKGMASGGKTRTLIVDGQREGSTYAFAVQAFNAVGTATTTLRPLVRPIR
jgi:titin